MGVSFQIPHPMTADEFFAFTATRPDEEKWELIDGEPIMNASATRLHSIIAGNIFTLVQPFLPGRHPQWEVLQGLAVRLTPTSVRVPDLLIRPAIPVKGSECDDMVIAFEVLSPSTADRDLRWKREASSMLPSLQQYVVLAQDAAEGYSYNRENAFAERRFDTPDSLTDLHAVGLSLRLADLYIGTGLS
jgi:Uma2 family endonuclease